MAPKIYNNQQPSKFNARSHNRVSGKPLKHTNLDDDDDAAVPNNPIITRWMNAICPRCLQVHVSPVSGQKVPGGKMWWCTSPPASRHERENFIENRLWKELGFKNIGEAAPAPSGAARGWGERARSELEEDLAIDGISDNIKLGHNKPDNSKQQQRRKELTGRARQRRRIAMVRLRDDAEDGIDLAHDEAAQLPSDRSANEMYFPSGERYYDVDSMLTMDDIRHEEPTFVIKTVTRRRRGRKGKKKAQDEVHLGGKEVMVHGVWAGDREASDEDEYEFVDGLEDDEDDDVLSVAEWEELD